jgi:Kef-type K+ transport system membrane component KefB
MTVIQVVVAVAAIIVTTRAVGYLFQRIDQPPVIGELVGGILLGPSFLGWAAPEISSAILPPAIMPILWAQAQAGVVLFMFLVGLELDLGAIRQRGRAVVVISQASIALPFVLGFAMAGWLHPRLAPGGVPFVAFALFLGVSMSVTAFPVLARILRDRGISRTPMGAVALACAAVNDVTAWALLAVVVSIAEFGDWSAVLTHLPEVVAGHVNHYAIFAAFGLGAVMPGRRRLSAALHDRLASIVSLLFLPVFFAYSGVRTEIGLIGGAANWLICGAIILVACIGKFGGSVTAARLLGLPWLDAAALGVLMNTRGLVELIVLNIGLDLGVISPTLFTMLVIMALVTTFMTSPLLLFMLRRNPWTVVGVGSAAK